MKHYIPIDRDGELRAIVKENFVGGQFVLIDKVFKELCDYESGVVFKEFPFLKNKELIEKTNHIIPSLRFYNSVDSFIDPKVVHRKSRPLTSAEIELEKTNYPNKTDGRILVYADYIRAENPIIITEETIKANDGKLIRKIPYNCSIMDLQCCNFPTLLKEKFSVNISRK